MLRFPNAKINLGLNVISRRVDGYHDIGTVFYPVDWCDLLEIIESPGEFSFTMSGLPVPGGVDSNLCIKAYQLLKEEYQIPPVKMHLHKIIPMGAGLGGGSSDAAFVLIMLNEMFGLGLSESQLILHAAALGSDCPFFILNKPVFASGRGELMKPVPLNLAGFHVIILKPPVHVSTAEAFASLKPKQPSILVAEIVKNPVEKWTELLMNDFETTIFRKFQEIKILKDKLYDAGALYASMSGSGSSVYGIFKEKISLSGLSDDVIKWEGVFK